ncbi:SpoIIIAH-like family protein [Jeotgalibacillus haloalkalitolerans]|uniref:SpoIIIAH-like family protein n=1 Tax=Jeotgalibacillus haloalkalitolerans TaxID=3104292 RepID=A0ABU5KLL6_9BACL|nr:SpoIIIAH-like family protein [Jeotgalibacillus sp. HH7-29]MDZ5712128.1 SpoIIIAH-like family protein [Jeotgalibacillus sp. HH7-29]
MLKKQTVWLLTMIGLVVVLSVYYVMSPTSQTAVTYEDSEVVSTENGEEWVFEDEVDVATESSPEDLFNVLRMEVQDERSALKEQLTSKVASADFSAAEKDEAYEAMEELNRLESKEKLIETMIRAMGYEDALVRTDEERVLITVKSIDQEHSKEAANELVQLGRREMGENTFVSVMFEPAE